VENLVANKLSGDISQALLLVYRADMGICLLYWFGATCNVDSVWAANVLYSAAIANELPTSKGSHPVCWPGLSTGRKRCQIPTDASYRSLTKIYIYGTPCRCGTHVRFLRSSRHRPQTYRRQVEKYINICFLVAAVQDCVYPCRESTRHPRGTPLKGGMGNLGNWIIP
jgi:hypothetical protein